MRIFKASRFGIEQCGDLGHHWKELRSKNKMTECSWHFFKHCVNCPAVLETIITHYTTPKGNIEPKAKMFFIGIDETAEIPIVMEESEMVVAQTEKEKAP